MNTKTLKSFLPARPKDAHKGRFGHLLIVAGSRGMGGAAVLAARAAVRSGAGLVTAAVPGSLQNALVSAVPEALTLGLPETSTGGISAGAAGLLREAHASRTFTALAVGPGLGTHAKTASAVAGLLGSLGVPAVLDADALNLLAAQSRAQVKKLLAGRGAPVVLTPHPGEAARLLRLDAGGVEADREGAAKELARFFSGVCLLKGAGTLVTDGKRLYRNATGNAGLAKGGSGDVLTGLIAGLWTQRLKAGSKDSGFPAACLGAYLHGLAADLALRETTSRCLTASDVIAALPRAFKKLSL